MAASWDRVKEILAQALERAPDSRSEFVRSACAADRELQAEIESLLAYHDQADSLLENSPARHVLAHPLDAFADKKLGVYRLLREIGRGGMAVVYLAERDDQEFRKRVAIKMLAAGFYTEDILQRFRNERQTLAALDHPSIVKLLDGGTTGDRMPYLVMEYVEGVPIDAFCEARGLSISDRLRLFVKVCAAVQYAHENGVVHRDLKPGNILIAPDGVPRLLDFGIAKLQNPELLDTALITRTDTRPMTAEYASPEQIRGVAVTKASDIYALGVLLYELLAGRRPFTIAERSRAEFDLLVCEEEPERPSAALRNSTELRRAVEGDLDTITLKALRKEPQRRYGSAGELAADVERHLAGRPVAARNPTLAYRGGRFMRRHKESLATALVMVAIAVAIGAWALHNRAVASHATAPHVRRQVAILGFKNLAAQPRAAWLSTALSEMLAAQLAAGEELRLIPTETVARTRMDLNLTDFESVPKSALERVRKNLGSGLIATGSYLDENGGKQIHLDVRLVDAESGETIASAAELGSESGLTDLASRTGARLRQRLGLSRISELEAQQIAVAFPTNPEAMRLYSEGLSRLQALDALAARDLLTRAMAVEPSFGLGHASLASAWSSLGYDAKARAEAKQALDRAGSLSRESHLLVEARYHETTKNWPKAIEAYQVLANFFPDTPEYALDLAHAQTSGGKGQDAIATLEALTRRIAGDQEDPRIDLGISAAAASLGDNKLRRDAADRAAEKAQRQGSRLLAARARNLECRALANLGENQRAKAACDESVRIFKDAGDRGGLARALHSTAEVPLNQGDFAGAGELYRQALAIDRDIGNCLGMATDLVNLGVVSMRRGEFAQAHKYYAESFENYQQAGDLSGMAVVSGNTGNLLRSEGRLAEAHASYERAMSFSNQLGHRGATALALAAIGNLLAEEGDLAGAHKNLAQALAIQKDLGQRVYYAETLVNIAEVYEQQAEFDRARKLLDEAMAIHAGLGDKGGEADVHLGLSELALDMDQPAESEKLARWSLERFRAEAQADKQTAAAGMVARALVAERKAVEAGRALDEVADRAHTSRNIAVRLSFDLNRARTLAALNDSARAEELARRVERAAGSSMVRIRLEAALLVGQIHMRGDRAEGRRRLNAVVREARSKGFELIARRAELL